MLERRRAAAALVAVLALGSGSTARAEAPPPPTRPEALPAASTPAGDPVAPAPEGDSLLPAPAGDPVAPAPEEDSLLPASAGGPVPPAPEKDSPLPASAGDPLPSGSGRAPPRAQGVSALEVYDPLFDEEENGGDLFERDPLERANRWTFAFNQGLDFVLLDPLTRGYQWLLPASARRGVNRVFDNLNSPVVFANEVLQLRPRPAAGTFVRFVANSTLGLAGIFDVADEVMHLPRTEADFGQTLARYWVPRGPYLVVPLFGPSTVRDALGTVVDQALDPLTYIIGPLNLQWQLILGSGQGLALRDANLEAIDALREASVDYYSALRSAYLQNRRKMELEVLGAAVWEGGASWPDQDSVPEASFAMRSSIAAISASKSSRLTIPENSERRSASSLTVPSR